MGLDWRLGSDWFQHTLIDHDPAINQVMWQNASLVGVDPFYRGIEWEKTPDGSEDDEYISKWLHEQLVWSSKD
jgi:deoxyribodipyrimidine photolyase